MANIIEEITIRLQEVNHILTSKKEAKDVPFDDALAIAQFYYDYQDTNHTIDMIEDLVHQNKEALYASALKLKEEVDCFMGMDLQIWKTLDYHGIEQSHLKVYKDKWELIKEKATKLWQEYQAQSNRLDMMSYDDENFSALDAQCDQTKSAYNEVHQQNEEAYNIYRNEQIKCGHVHFFEMQFLELLILKLARLVHVILDDKKCVGKEGTT